MELDYALLDVFAERALEGNMLAVFTDARGLSTEQMQALARETNLAETTFIVPSDVGDEVTDGVTVRIFTTQEELQFAGHPTLGTASWLFLNHPVLRGAEEIRLKLKSGVIPVRFTPSAGPGVTGTMRQNDPVFGDMHDPAEVASVLGVAMEDLDEARPIETVSTGMAFCVVPFRSVVALGRLESAPARVQAWLDRVDAKFFYCLAPSRTGYRARMQFYNGEDPATGSAAGCAISYLVRHGYVASGTATVIEQGIEIRRPSRIEVRATLSENCVRDVLVGGRTISVATGRFFLP